jgi:ABC-type Fe3+ transport system permease subunit
MVGLVFAYLVRFLAVSSQTVEASLVQITPSMDMAARSLGASPGEVLRRVHLPLIRGGLGCAAILVFVDVMKEMPATLLLRPFGYDTLAVRISSPRNRFGKQRLCRRWLSSPVVFSPCSCSSDGYTDGHESRAMQEVR